MFEHPSGAITTFSRRLQPLRVLFQFIKAKNEDVTESVVRDATVGMKEADTTINAALNSLFAPLTRKRAKELGLTEMDEAKYVGRLCQEVEATGKLSTIATGDGLLPAVLSYTYGVHWLQNASRIMPLSVIMT